MPSEDRAFAGPQTVNAPGVAAKPRWSRRKDARPAEIIEAALDLFIEQGFSATKLDDIARRAGLAKGTLYRYFDTKQELFRAVVHDTVAGGLPIFGHAAAPGTSFEQIVPVLLQQAAENVEESRAPAMLRMVLAESRTFPDLATIWQEEVVSPMLATISGFIEEAQESGEVSPGDPRLMALTMIGPMLAGIIFGQVFWTSDTEKLDLRALAVTAANASLRGMLK